LSGTNDNNFTLYLHITPSGKKYFGITGLKAKKRWNSGYGYKNNRHFWRAIEKYGWNNIQHIILADDLTKDNACLFEQIFIALYDTTNHNNGYNNSTGGECSANGCKHKLSEEHKQKISESLKGEKNPMFGKDFSDEHRRKLSESHKGKKSFCAKTIICITTGQVFYGSEEAGRIVGINSSNIRKVCRGEKKSAGKLPDGTKLRWAYIQDLPKPQLTEEQKQFLRNGPRLLKSA
jgi:group I intron endonuclease